MGKLKKGFNWKARQVVNVSVTETKNPKVEIQLESGKNENYDDCNALVLPSKKRKTKLAKSGAKPTVKVLSKKQRKHLEKIVERKKKKANRSSLLEALSKVQAPEGVIDQLTSITEIQTKGVKRLRDLDDDNNGENDNLNGGDVLSNNIKRTKINAIAGSKRKLLLSNSKIVNSTNDPNIVGFELSDEESDIGEEEEDEEKEKESDEEEKEDNKKVVKEEAVNGKLDSSSGTSVECELENNDFVANGDLNNSVDSDNLKNNVSDCFSNSNSDVKETNTISSGIKEVFKNKWTITDVGGVSKESKNLKNCNNVQNNSVDNVTDIKKPPKPAIFVPVIRKKEIEIARLKLPILGEEQGIMEAINENPIVIIAGETGSGKTTQVPQFLYEAGYALGGRMIGVTEPRRVAAISMSQRVGEELNMPTSKVSYLIRFEGNVTPETQIKFMTDGVLLKEIQTDFLLTKYSVIILDEAHERSVYTDILIGFLSRIVPLRNKRNIPLKLIIMSATLRISDFTENKRLFKIPPPVLKVESRQYPVSIHFNKRTNPDYVREAYRKACKIHTQLPEGGILIFVTGQQEVNILMKKLRNTFPARKDTNTNKVKGKDNESNSDNELDTQLEDTLHKKRKAKKRDTQIPLPQIDLSKYSLVPNDDTEGDVMDGDIDSEGELDDGDEDDDFLGGSVSTQPMWVLPLYSLLPSHKQAQVFKPPPEGYRLCVVATNIAETSLTIPHVKYVVDSGKAKTKVYDKHTGVSAFTVVWTSQAAANQRAGRAGRMGPGHCYRLYSSAVFNDEFELWSVPEIQKQPVDDLVLQLKAIGINKVVNFPFPSPPDAVQLNSAGRRLSLLGALPPLNPNVKDDNWNGKLTELGEAMSIFPVAPRFGKMLCLSHQHNLMEYTITIVAALSVQEILLLGDQNWAKTRRKWAGVGNSFLLGDVMVLMRAIGASEYANSKGNMEKFCEQNGLRLKAVLEVRKLRLQLTKEINVHAPELNLYVNPKMPPPTEQQANQLRQIVLAGLVDQVARRVPNEEAQEAGIRKGKAVYRTIEMEEFVYIHPNSAFYKEQPEWVVYQQVTEMSKMYMIGLTAIEPNWLPVFAPTLCNLTTLNDPPPRYNNDTGTPFCVVSGTFGRGGWQIPNTEVEFPPGLDRYKWFAVFFLDGSVCPLLEKYVKHLLSKPFCMVKSWSKLLPRTNMLLKGLVDKEVSSRSKLHECWAADSKYLLAEYLTWLPESIHNEITGMWPPCSENE